MLVTRLGCSLGAWSDARIVPHIPEVVPTLSLTVTGQQFQFQLSLDNNSGSRRFGVPVAVTGNWNPEFQCFVHEFRCKVLEF